MRRNAVQKNAVIADTYAIVELFKKNPSFFALGEEHTWIITEHALVEIYHYALKNYGERIARITYHAWRQRVEPLTEDATNRGMRFKLEHKNENPSYADCIGWGTAQALGIPFLTGDKAFKGKPGVLWVQ